MPSFCTWTGCGKAIGWMGERCCEEEAPLYAESITAPAARATSPGMAVHFLRLVIAMG